MTATGHIHIGIYGWRYAGWRGVFYPKGLPQKDELSYAGQTFNSVEINGTHYSLQRPEYFAAWAAAVPEDFVFAVKGPRYITHMLRLKGIEDALPNFFAQGVLRLGRKLGPFLWQFPGRFAYDTARLEPFLANLPKSTSQLAAFARRHDARVAGRAWLDIDADRPVRHAIEVRHESFRCREFIQQLRRHGVGLVVSDAVGWPCLMDLTADFVYCRLHGSEELYASGYDAESINTWAERVTAWTTGSEPADAIRADPNPAPQGQRRDVYIYFDNDKKVRAPFDALGLMKRMKDRGLL